MKKIAILFLTVLMAWPVAASASPVTFSVSEDFSYDDNIYLTDGDETDSFISATNVGAQYKANIPGSGLELSANGLVGYNAYTEDSSTNNFWNAAGSVQLKNSWLNVGDNFIYTSDPANSALTERAERIQNIGYVSFKTSSEKKFGVGISADDVFDRYMKSEWSYLNRNRVNLGAQLYYNVSPKTNFFAEYTYSDINYQDNKENESTGNSVGLGVNGQLASKLSGTAKITYDMRDYDESIAGVDSYNDLVGYYVALEWQPTARNTVRLSGQRRMEETLYGNNRYFADTLVSLYASQKIYDKWTASLTLSWEDMDYAYEYQGEKRNDGVYTIRPEVDYQFKDWLSAGVWYQWRNRDSNTEGYDYDSNKAGVFVKALF